MKIILDWSVIALVFLLTACAQKSLHYEVPAPAPVARPAPVKAAAPPAPTPTAVAPPAAQIIAPAKPAPDITKYARSKAKPKFPEESAASASIHETAEIMSVKKELAETNKITSFLKIKVELAADPIITTPGNPGDLRVWIGDPDLKANFPAGMTTDSAVIATSEKPSTVLVKPNAPAFDVSPESICSKFDPAGTTVPFKLMPKLERAGKYRVGAGVWLYDSNDCTGTPKPKEAPDLQVEVNVKLLPDDLSKNFREFISKSWVELLGLFAALLLFFARNLLKKMFGFESK